MKIACIDDRAFVGDDKFTGLTKGKIYDAIEIREYTTIIIDDLNRTNEYWSNRSDGKNRFISLQEYRKNKLNKLYEIQGK